MPRYKKNNTKPIVGANVVTFNMCLIIKAQVMAGKKQKKNNNDDKNNLEDDSIINGNDSDSYSKNKEKDNSYSSRNEEFRMQKKWRRKEIK